MTARRWRSSGRFHRPSSPFPTSSPAPARRRPKTTKAWLIGTHHGHGRPFFPAVEWPPPGVTFATCVDDADTTITSAPPPSLAELQARWLDLHATLHQRYGAWRLAHFDAILRLADHRRSQYEQKQEDDADENVDEQEKEEKEEEGS